MLYLYLIIIDYIRNGDQVAFFLGQQTSAQSMQTTRKLTILNPLKTKGAHSTLISGILSKTYFQNFFVPVLNVK